MRVRTTSRALAVGAALALVLSACGSDDDTAEPEATEEESVDDGAEEEPEATEEEEPEDDGEAVADGEPLKIGVLTSETGPFTPWGIQAIAGMEMAADEINAAGGVDGRPIELVVADDENNPDVATTEMERMIEQDGVVAIGGVISSSVGVVAGEVAEDLGVPTFMIKGGSPAVLTPESRHTFRTCLPSADMTAGPLLSYVQQEGLERVGVVIADYAWGQAVRAAIESTFADSGVELQIEVAPVTETDFTTYLRSIADFDPDILAATGHPPGSGPITLQASDLGLDVPVTGPWAPFATVVGGVGEVAYDSYADYSCVDYSSPEYQELAAEFAAIDNGFTFMEDDAVAGYGIVNMVAEAVAEVGDDPGAIAEYLHANEFEVPGYSHVLSWTEYGELAAAQPTLSIVRQTAPPAGINEGADWYVEVLSTSDVLEPTPAPGG